MPVFTRVFGVLLFQCAENIDSIRILHLGGFLKNFLENFLDRWAENTPLAVHFLPLILHLENKKVYKNLIKT